MNIHFVISQIRNSYYTIKKWQNKRTESVLLQWIQTASIQSQWRSGQNQVDNSWLSAAPTGSVRAILDTEAVHHWSPCIAANKKHESQLQPYLDFTVDILRINDNFHRQNHYCTPKPNFLVHPTSMHTIPKHSDNELTTKTFYHTIQRFLDKKFPATKFSHVRIPRE